MREKEGVTHSHIYKDRERESIIGSLWLIDDDDCERCLCNGALWMVSCVKFTDIQKNQKRPDSLL